MKYYVTSDIHGFYSIFRKALEESGYFTDSEPHKLIILGDLFDRGTEALELQEFIIDCIDKDEVILIKGNHEDLYEELVTVDKGLAYRHHIANGTFVTAILLSKYSAVQAMENSIAFAKAARDTPLYTRIIPSMLDYYETENYVFTHGWIPCIHDRTGYSYCSDWRNSSPKEFSEARWYNGIDAAQTCLEEKTILCGHWHASYGHSHYEHSGPEHGEGADFSPYYGPGVIALDACTAHSGKINIVVIEDNPLGEGGIPNG